MMIIEKTIIEIGLAKPLKVLHITDSHMPLCDERDDAYIQWLAARKRNKCEGFLAALEEQTEYAEEHCDLLVHTGDLIDFLSKANLEFARKWLKNDKVLYIAGNHEYYTCAAWENMAYRLNSVMKMGPEGMGVNLFFAARRLGGVNFVGIDDAYHQVEEWQLERLRMEVEKGFPVILFMHAPLFEEALFQRSVEYWKDGSSYLVGCDETHLMSAGELNACGQRPTEATRRFVDYVNGEKRIRAVLAGHVHFNFESNLPGGTMQYVTGLGAYGNAREITII